MDIVDNSTDKSLVLPVLRGLRKHASSSGLLAPQYILLAFLATPIILLLPPTSIMRKACQPVQLYLILCAFIAPLPQEAPQADLYNAGLLIGGWSARIIDRMYMHIPEKEFLRESIDEKPGHGPETYGIWRKFWWGAEMISSQRGVGWNWMVSGVPKPDYTTRWPFIWNRLFKSFLTFLLIHLVSVSASAILEGDDIGPPEWKDGLLRHPLFLRLFITVGWLTVVYGHVALPENILAIAFVGSGFWGRWSDPKLWPPMFGDIGESYTLRRCWGKFWHSMLRRTTNAPGEWIVYTFPSLRRPKSHAVRLARRYGLLFLAFATSGLIHASGSYMVTRDSPGGISDGGATVYFLAQPVAICIEDALFALLGIDDDGMPSLLRRMLGYTHVACFWLWCFPTLKVLPLADAHGLGDPRGDMLGAVRACKELADAFPINPAKSLWEYLAELKVV